MRPSSLITMEIGEMILSVSGKTLIPRLPLISGRVEWKLPDFPKRLSQSSENRFTAVHRPWSVGRYRRPATKEIKNGGDFCVPNVHGRSSADCNRRYGYRRPDDICQAKTSTKE